MWLVVSRSVVVGAANFSFYTRIHNNNSVETTAMHNIISLLLKVSMNKKHQNVYYGEPNKTLDTDMYFLNFIFILRNTTLDFYGL